MAPSSRWSSWSTWTTRCSTTTASRPTSASTSSRPSATECRDRYAAILQQLWDTLGYRDYLGALQRYRVEHPQHVELLAMSSCLLDYPFAERLYPGALQVLAHLKRIAPVVVLSDGDVVFQPRKVQRAGHRRGGGRPGADLHPQGAGAGRRAAALSRPGTTY